MSYDPTALACKVKAMLEANPNLPLHSISRELTIDRHTIDRAVKKIFHVDFRTLKNQIKAGRIDDALCKDPLKPIKHTAAEVGYASATSLAKCTRRAFGMPPTKIRGRERP